MGVAYKLARIHRLVEHHVRTTTSRGQVQPGLKMIPASGLQCASACNLH